MTISLSTTQTFYLEEGLRGLPRLMGMVNLNPLSSSYGCFDRAYWHYRVVDFPSGSYQYTVLAVALAYQIKALGNVLYQNDSAKEIVSAAISFAEKSSHPEGSCDDYYLNEKAAGATAFSLYALTEAFLLLELDRTEFHSFFQKRADWLIHNNEPYPLSNHQALIALGLWNVFLITGKEKYRQKADEKIRDTLSLYCDEGWFKEYGGLDAGYLTFTINFLAKYYQKTEQERLMDPLRRAIEMAAYFCHPDGSYGGDYGSRSCATFLCHGLEILADKAPMATALADQYVEGFLKGKNVYPEDDRNIFLIVTDRLQSYLDFSPSRQSWRKKEDGTYYFQEAGIVVHKTPRAYWVISGKKAGANRFFLDDQNIHNDCGFIGKLSRGPLIATFSSDSFCYNQKAATVVVKGEFAIVKRDRAMNDWRVLLFKYCMFLIGGIPGISKRIKSFLTCWLITSPSQVPVSFERTFFLREPYRVQNTLSLRKGKVKLDRLYWAHHVSFAYVAASQFFEESALQPWRDLSPKLKDLHENSFLSWDQVFPLHHQHCD